MSLSPAPEPCPARECWGTPVFCPEFAQADAALPSAAWTNTQFIVHGLLHLLGYDHDGRGIREMFAWTNYG